MSICLQVDDEDIRHHKNRPCTKFFSYEVNTESVAFNDEQYRQTNYNDETAAQSKFQYYMILIIWK